MDDNRNLITKISMFQNNLSQPSVLLKDRFKNHAIQFICFPFFLTSSYQDLYSDPVFLIILGNFVLSTVFKQFWTRSTSRSSKTPERASWTKITVRHTSRTTKYHQRRIRNQRLRPTQIRSSRSREILQNRQRLDQWGSYSRTNQGRRKIRCLH